MRALPRRQKNRNRSRGGLGQRSPIGLLATIYVANTGIKNKITCVHHQEGNNRSGEADLEQRSPATWLLATIDVASTGIRQKECVHCQEGNNRSGEAVGGPTLPSTTRLLATICVASTGNRWNVMRAHRRKQQCTRAQLQPRSTISYAPYRQILKPSMVARVHRTETKP